MLLKSIPQRFWDKSRTIFQQMGNGASSSGVKGGGIPTLYIYGLSAPARAAWMTAKAAEIPVHLKYIDLFKGEHKTPEFAKVTN